ncbi:MAG TPA: hypothetical protein DHU59_13495 [Clostridiales bacterium]|nr:hypothetical protein [Clostridiales bacterium]
MIKFKYNPTKNQRITSEFGKRDFAGLQFHSGVDLGAITPGVEGDELYAVDDGIVRVSKADSGNKNIGYGYYIVIEHEGYCTLYAHLTSLELKVGQTVKAGDIVARMGNTGTSTAAHLHFEVRNCLYSDPYFWTKGQYAGQYIMCVNPINYFAKEMTVQEAIDIIQSKTGIDENTVQYLLFYKYSEPLLLKLAAAMK